MSPAAQLSVSGNRPNLVLHLSIKKGKDGPVLCSAEWKIPVEDPMSEEDERGLSRAINSIIEKAISKHGVPERCRRDLQGMFVSMVRQWFDPNGPERVAQMKEQGLL